MKHLKITVQFLVVILLVTACKQKPKSEEEKFFPVMSFLKSQVAQVDSSLNSIVKYVYIDSLHTDTAYIPRDQFKQEAADFLSIPDLTDERYEGKYKEEDSFDETLNRVMVIATPVKPEEAILQRQEILIKPDVAAGDKVMNILFTTITNNRDSSVKKNMIWKVDESFQVTTIKQLAGKPETVTTVKVVWNEKE